MPGKFLLLSAHAFICKNNDYNKSNKLKTTLSFKKISGSWKTYYSPERKLRVFVNSPNDSAFAKNQGEDDMIHYAKHISTNLTSKRAIYPASLQTIYTLLWSTQKRHHRSLTSLSLSERTTTWTKELVCIMRFWGQDVARRNCFEKISEFFLTLKKISEFFLTKNSYLCKTS